MNKSILQSSLSQPDLSLLRLQLPSCQSSEGEHFDAISENCVQQNNDTSFLYPTSSTCFHFLCKEENTEKDKDITKDTNPIKEYDKCSESSSGLTTQEGSSSKEFGSFKIMEEIGYYSVELTPKVCVLLCKFQNGGHLGLCGFDLGLDQNRITGVEVDSSLKQEIELVMNDRFSREKFVMSLINKICD